MPLGSARGGRGRLAAAQEASAWPEASHPDADFHELRKRAKRARYTAELIAPIMGRRAARAAAASSGC